MSSLLLSRLSEMEIKEFEEVYHKLAGEVQRSGSGGIHDMPETLNWLKTVLDYNVPHGKKIRGLMVPLTYKALVPYPPDKSDMKLTYVLGWCIEMLQAAFLVADDIMDGSRVRRGKPCWYKVDNMGVIAFNDAFLLEHVVYRILSSHFKEQPYYPALVELFLDTTFKTIVGQSLDTKTGNEKNLDEYNMERYASIVKYKTSYYTIYLPIALALVMVGSNKDTDDPDDEGLLLLKKVETISLEIGHFFQVQDDYLDCYGEPSVTGKVGTDIQDSKCSWLFVVAKEKCGVEQFKLLMENYGYHNEDRIKLVKGLYNELGIPGEYERYERASFDFIRNLILCLDHPRLESVFEVLLNLVYKRQK